MDDILQLLLNGGSPEQQQQAQAEALRSKMNLQSALQNARDQGSQYDILNFVAQNSRNPALAKGVEGLASAAQARNKPQALGQTGVILGDQYVENPGYTEQKQADRQTRQLTAAGQIQSRRDALLQQALLAQERMQQGQDRNDILRESIATRREIANGNLAIRRYLAGMGDDGGADPSFEAAAQAVASGKLPPPSGAAAMMPRNQRMMQRVMEINPNYDYADVQARTKAMKDFTTGQQGNTIRSLATANAHLDQLGTMVDALNNGNINVFNKVANAYGAATGDVAPTNFDAVKEIVAKEVVKAIVANGGGEGEREKAAALLDRARSPQQLFGIIKNQRMLLGAQHDNLVQQALSAGVPREKIPSYAGSSGPKRIKLDVNGNILGQ